jgi:hypothetical protein
MAALPTLVGTKSIGSHSTGAPLAIAFSVWLRKIAGEASTSPEAIRSNSAGGMMVCKAISWTLSFLTNSGPLVRSIAPMTL